MRVFVTGATAAPSTSPFSIPAVIAAAAIAMFATWGD